jgi:LmbE family N-acetylglucosaminyl deacetylase
MQWIYLSPHLDDVALSVGGLLWEQSQAGEQVGVWTICAGDPPAGQLSPFAKSLHQRWGVGGEATMAMCRLEDRESCQRLGASHQHFNLPDCIYRRSARTGQPLYNTEAKLFGEIHPHEDDLIARVCQDLRSALPRAATLVCPAGVGGHVDHRLARRAVERLDMPLYYYGDYPYVLEAQDWQPVTLRPKVFRISSRGLAAWQTAIAAHTSQISTFWVDLDEMRAAIGAYCHQNGGVILWCRDENVCS